MITKYAILIGILMLQTLVRSAKRAIAEETQVIEEFPTNVTVAENEVAILPCRVDHYENQMVVWMNPKRIVVSQKESRFINDPRLSIERPFLGDYNLHIRGVRYEDRGDYTCTVNTDPVTIKRVRLIVHVPSQILNYSTSNEVRVAEGNDVELTCNATGVPSPVITWYRVMGDNPQDKEKVGSEGELLVIKNISRHCGGIYECMAYNQVPPAVSRQMRVVVHFKPSIKLLTRRLGQEPGREAMLVCIITASPQGSNVWRFGNHELTERSKGYNVEVYQENNKYQYSLNLRIKSVSYSDYGMYTCEAFNSLGHASAQMELYEFHRLTPPPLPTPKNAHRTLDEDQEGEITEDKRNKHHEERTGENNNHIDRNAFNNDVRTGYRPKSSNVILLGQFGTDQTTLNSSNRSLLPCYFLIVTLILTILCKA